MGHTYVENDEPSCRVRMVKNYYGEAGMIQFEAAIKGGKPTRIYACRYGDCRAISRRRCKHTIKQYVKNSR